MRILVPVDGSQDSKEILEVASDIAKSIKAEVNLMTLIPGIEYMDLDYSARQRVSLERKLTAQAEKGGFDITVIGTRGLGAKAHFFLGGLASRRSCCNCYVLVVKM